MLQNRIIKLSEHRSGNVRFLTGLHVHLEEGKATSWVTVTRTGRFKDPRYGTFDITRELLQGLGVKVPLEGAKGYSVTAGVIENHDPCAIWTALTPYMTRNGRLSDASRR